MIADEVFAEATAVVDAWFDAWSIANDAARRSAFEKIAAADVRFSDRLSAVESLTDLAEHAGAVQRFMPGVHLQRQGAIRHCQGAVLADWTMSGGRGPTANGTNLFMLSGEGRITAVVGFAHSPPG